MLKNNLCVVLLIGVVIVLLFVLGGVFNKNFESFDVKQEQKAQDFRQAEIKECEDMGGKVVLRKNKWRDHWLIQHCELGKK